MLQWGELPTSVAYIGTGQIMGWGNKAIEIRSVETGHLDGVFMHKKAQKLKFLCERNDKVQKFEKPRINDLLLMCSGFLLQRQGRLLVPDLLHDAEQARHGELVEGASVQRPRSSTYFSPGSSDETK